MNFYSLKLGVFKDGSKFAIYHPDTEIFVVSEVSPEDAFRRFLKAINSPSSSCPDCKWKHGANELCPFKDNDPADWWKA